MPLHALSRGRKKLRALLEGADDDRMNTRKPSTSWAVLARG